MIRYIERYIFILLAVIFLVGCNRDKIIAPDLIDASHFLGQSKGLFVNFKDIDYTSTQKYSQDIDNIVKFTKAMHLNTLYVDALADGKAGFATKSIAVNSGIDAEKDPLKYICEKAKADQIVVHAVVEPVWSSIDITKKVIDELVESYDIFGVMLDTRSEGMSPELVEQLAEYIRTKNKNIQLSIALTMGEAGFARSALEQLVDRASPSAVALNSGEYSTYTELLTSIGELSINNTPVVMINEYNADSKYQLYSQLLENSISGTVAGSIIKDYSSISGLDSNSLLMLSSSFSVGGSSIDAAKMKINNSLSVRHPPEKYTTAEDNVYVVGTANPDAPLTINGKAVGTRAKGGTFGEYVQLKSGENILRVENGDSVLTLAVNKVAAETERITEIPANALFPLSDVGFDSIDNVNISVIAPAGWTVSATVGTSTIVLKQKKTASTGSPVEFTGTFNVRGEKVGKNEVKSLGKVTYILSGGGGDSKVQTSKGELLVAGANVPLFAEVTAPITTARKDVKVDDYGVALKQGAKFMVHKKLIVENMGQQEYAYQLADGSYVMARDTKIVREPEQCKNELVGVTATDTDKLLDIKLLGGTPGVVSSLDGSVLTLKILNSDTKADFNSVSSPLIKSIELLEGAKTDTLTIELNTELVWGYDVRYIDGNTHIYIKRSPQLGQSVEKPLEGLTVMLDAGHGGKNPGALGAAGQNGPNEADINDVYTAMVRFRLTQLGAEVKLTREFGAEDIDIRERLKLADEYMPDIFISIHHNSTQLHKNINEISGVECYYNNTISQPLAQRLVSHASVALNRKAQEPEQAGYYVTRMTYAPSVLLELGYIINPLEYEEILLENNISTAAVSIAEAVLNTVKQS